jgi:hypothetical protein
MNMTDQAGAARDDGKTAHDVGRYAAVAKRGGDRTGGVDGDVFAVPFVDGLRQRL